MNDRSVMILNQKGTASVGIGHCPPKQLFHMMEGNHEKLLKNHFLNADQAEAGQL